MADPIPISLGLGSNVSRYGLEGVAEFINAYAEQLGESGKVQYPIYAINGLEAFATLTGGDGVRAMLPLEPELLVVAGRILFRVNAGGTATSVGGIPSDGLVTMARNRKAPNPQVAIVCDGLWYTYENGTLTQGSDTDLPPPICVVGMDGFFIFPIADGRWFITSVDEGTEVDGLEFSRAGTRPDGLVIGAVRGRDLVLSGSRSTEFHQNTGGADFPFTLTTSIDIGCYAAASMANITLIREQAVDTLIWAATDANGGYMGVVLLNGYTPTVISTGEIDRLIRDEPDPSNLRATAWTEDGHPFYAISGTSFTRVYDGRTGQWHTRSSYGRNGRSRISCHAQFGQKHIFGDTTTNKLYWSRPDVYTEDGDPIVWTVIPPPVSMFPHRFRVNALHLDTISGVGLVSSTDAQANPTLMIDYTRDGGATFGAQRRSPLGAAGQRFTRITERQFGIFDKNGVSFRFSCSANVRKGLMSAAIEADKLNA